MKKKIAIISIIIILIGIFIASHLSIYARVAEQPLYVNLTATNPNDANKVGYGIGDPNNAGKYIWHITTNDLTASSNRNAKRTTKKFILCKC